MTTPYETASKLPGVGDPAPRFKLSAYPSGTISLDAYAGKKNVILAFYPMDDTPGCTKEMCAFSADLNDFNNANTEVLGISCDSTRSHESFAHKHHLKLPLLSDEDGEVGRAYGVLSSGKKTANRVLFVIDKQSTVRHVFEGMPTNADLLKVVKELK